MNSIGIAAITGFTSPEERLIGVLPPGFFDRYGFLGDNPWDETGGVSLGEGATHAVLVLPVQDAPAGAPVGEAAGPSLAIAAHELGHGFGLSVDPSIKNWTCDIDVFPFDLMCGASGALDEYEREDPALSKGNPSTGFWVLQGGEPSEVMRPGMVGEEQCDSHCLMGSSPANMHDNWGTCVFRPKLDTESGANWTVIPAETGRRFRSQLDGDSGLKLDTFWSVAGIG